MKKFKKGDKVMIMKGPIDKVGRKGIVTIPCVNGAIVQFDDGMATSVRSCNLSTLTK